MRVFITRKIPDAGPNLLREKGYEVVVREADGITPKAVLADALAHYDAVISLLSDPLDADVIRRADRCRIIANYAVGTNNIDIPAAKKKGMVVTHTPDVLTEATAELAMALLLAVSRRLLPADRYTREGRFTGWGPLLFIGQGLDGKTVGVIGMGRIGQAFARMVSAFRTRVLYTSRSNKPVPYSRVPLDVLLSESDVISLHLPLTPESHHLITKREFHRMKDGVVFINTARGPIVKESDLVAALQSGKVAAAGLDVYEYEPRVTEALKGMDQVVILPHIGSATEKARTEMALLTARNVDAVLSGQPPLTPVS